MITKLNLATYPFRNRTLPYVASVLFLIVSLAVCVFCLARLNSNKKANEAVLSENNARQAEIKRLTGEGEKVRQLLTPEQKAVLTAAHKLVANKTFGWSRLFADLESVLPGGVSASRITVQDIYQDGDRIKADLEFSVLSRDYPAVNAMIENMNNSGLFIAELRGQDLQKNERMTFTEYTFRLIYTPGYGYSASQPNDLAKNDMGGAQ